MIQALARNKILSQTNSSLKKQTLETKNREPVFDRHHERLDAAITQQLVGRPSKQSCKIGRPRKLDAEDGTRRNILPRYLEHYCLQELFITQQMRYHSIGITTKNTWLISLNCFVQFRKDKKLSPVTVKMQFCLLLELTHEEVTRRERKLMLGELNGTGADIGAVMMKVKKIYFVKTVMFLWLILA